MIDKIEKEIKSWINFNFIKQNVKTAKTILLLILTGFPLLNILIGIAKTTDGYWTFENFSETIAINHIGLLIIPFLLSVTFFGFLFQKEKVDLIASMPISKKSIFLSNTLLGIVIITIFQLIMMITSAIPIFLNAGQLAFAGRLLKDSFVSMTASYILLFTICNLAATLTGKLRGQIILIIIFAIITPLQISLLEGNFDRTYYFENKKAIVIDNDEITPMPLNYLSSLRVLFVDSSGVYPGDSTLYTCIISLGLIVLGTFLFKKKKLENSEEIFKTVVAHEVVKGLTMVTIVGMILYSMFNNATEFIFSIGNIIYFTLIIAYYIVYDLLTSKKVPITYTIISFGVMLVVAALVGAISLEDFELPTYYADVNDVSEVGINILDIDYFPGYYEYTGLVPIGTSSYEGTYTSTSLDTNNIFFTKNAEIKSFIKSMAKDTTVGGENRITIYLKLKNGKTIMESYYLSKENFRALLKLYDENTNYKQYLLSKFNPKDAAFKGDNSSVYNYIYYGGYDYSNNEFLEDSKQDKAREEVSNLFKDASLKEIVSTFNDIDFEKEGYTDESSVNKGYYAKKNNIQHRLFMFVYNKREVSKYTIYTDRTDLVSNY